MLESTNIIKKIKDTEDEIQALRQTLESEIREDEKSEIYKKIETLEKDKIRLEKELEVLKEEEKQDLLNYASDVNNTLLKSDENTEDETKAIIQAEKDIDDLRVFDPEEERKQIKEELEKEMKKKLEEEIESKVKNNNFKDLIDLEIKKFVFEESYPDEIYELMKKIKIENITEFNETKLFIKKLFSIPNSSREIGFYPVFNFYAKNTYERSNGEFVFIDDTGFLFNFKAVYDYLNQHPELWKEVTKNYRLIDGSSGIKGTSNSELFKNAFNKTIHNPKIQSNSRDKTVNMIEELS